MRFPRGLNNTCASITPLLHSSPMTTEEPRGMLPMTPSLKKVLAVSQREARQLGHNFVGTEHVLLAMLASNQSVASKILETIGLTHEMAVEAIVDFYNPNRTIESRITALETQVKELKENKP